MNFDPASRQITIFPAVGTAGTYTLTVTAANGVLPNAIWTMQLIITEALEPRWANPDGGTVYLLRDVALSEDNSTLNAVIQIPEVDVGETPVTYSLKSGITLTTGLTLSLTTLKLTGNPSVDQVDPLEVIVVATNIAGSSEYKLRIVVRPGVAPTLPADPRYVFPFITSQRSILRLPTVTNPDTVYPAPQYSLSTTASEQGPADSVFSPGQQTLIGVATEAERDATATTPGNIVYIAQNKVGSDDYNRQWRAVDRPEGEWEAVLEVPERLLEQIRQPGSIFSGLAWIPDAGSESNGVLLILDSGIDAVHAVSVFEGAYQRALSYEITSTAIRAAFASIYDNLADEVILPTGITYVQSTNIVYILDSISGHIFAFRDGLHVPDKDIPGSVVLGEIDSRIGGEPSGLTYNGRYLLVAIAGYEILAIDPVTKLPVSDRNITQGYLAESLAGQNVYVTGVSWTGQYVLALDSRTDSVFGFLNGVYDSLHDLSSETLRAATPNISPSGITYVGNRRCYIADAYENRIHVFRFSMIPVTRPPNDYNAPREDRPQPLFTLPDKVVDRDAINSAWPVGRIRLTGTAYDKRNDVLYVLNQFSLVVKAFRNGAHIEEYDVDISRIRLSRPQGITVLPESLGNMLMVVSQRRGVVFAFHTGTQAEQAEKNAVESAVTATGTATLSTDDGKVVSVDVNSLVNNFPTTTAVTGYRLQFQPPPSGGVTATGTVGNENIVGNRLVSITITNPGSGYVTAPGFSLEFRQTSLGETIRTFGPSDFTSTVNVGFSVASVALTDPGSGYQVAPQVLIASPGGTGDQATATAERNQDGTIRQLVLVNAGSGYVTAPTVTIADPPVRENDTSRFDMSAELLDQASTASFAFGAVTFDTVRQALLIDGVDSIYGFTRNAG